MLILFFQSINKQTNKWLARKHFISILEWAKSADVQGLNNQILNFFYSYRMKEGDTLSKLKIVDFI